MNGHKKGAGVLLIINSKASGKAPYGDNETIARAYTI